VVIRKLSSSDFDSILRIINNAAQAYKGVIPDDLWKEPYMSSEELRHEIDSGVEFYGWFENDVLLGVMGDPICRGCYVDSSRLCTSRTPEKRDW